MIAIVGRACVLPGALSPLALWQAVLEGRDLTSAVPAGRWKLAPDQVLCDPQSPLPDRTWTDRGGFVSGFEAIWDPQGFAIPPAQLAGLDPLLHWSLHCARQALAEVRSRPARIGAVLGNLGFPSESMAAFAEQVWTGRDAHIDPRNRSMSGGSAALLAQALGLSGVSFCLDAACASSLYAIKLACDELIDGRADLMLAGAVQRADPLFLQLGFAALGALSRSGQSRPFHRDADGLLPAEGCALLALKRLADARRDGDTIHAVIRGIGLSNDGRGKGLLVPDQSGQERAMQQAWQNAGLQPEQVSLLECHATGTVLGDATELHSSASVFAAANQLPIASLKSNLGHLITAAGAAGVIKLVEALRHGLRAPNRTVTALNPALDDVKFRLLQQAESWPDDQPRIAAISAFGFGGNNAHLILSADDPRLSARSPRRPARSTEPVAMVGLQCLVGSAADGHQFSDSLFAGQPLSATRTFDFELDLAGLRFPPNDLQQALPQQLTLLKLAGATLATSPLPTGTRCGVLIGMEPDAEVARFGSRWRLAAADAPADWRTAAQAALLGPLTAAGVLGCMPNIPANRLSSQFDLGGPGYTLQAGAASGLQALAIACRALQQGELDAVLVGAVDLCNEAVNRAAGNHLPLDAAISLLLKPLSAAQRDGDRIHALLQPTAEPGALPLPDLNERFGDAGAAAGLLQVVVASLCLQQRRQPDGRPWLAAAARRWALPAHGLELVEATSHGPCPERPWPRFWEFAGADRAAVVAALRSTTAPGSLGFGRAELAPLDLGKPSKLGSTTSPDPARLLLVATDDTFAEVCDRALVHLEQGSPAGLAVHFRERPLHGQLAFVFAGAGASYAGMGRELLLALPQLTASLARRSQRLATALDWAFDPRQSQNLSAEQQLWGASALSQLHLELSEGLLGLRADAWLGYSSGETNALVASGVWNDPDALLEEMTTRCFLSQHLGGEFAAVATQWAGSVDWTSWIVRAPLAEVRAALALETRVHLAIINSDADAQISGDRQACARVVERLGASRCLELDYRLAVHVPELAAMAEPWLHLHRRNSQAPRSGRIYSTAWGRAYTSDSEACAQAILDQALGTLDLRPLVLQAYADGVRIFVEHGPGNSFGRTIRSILGEREALVVSLDQRGQGISGLLATAAALAAAGVNVNLAALEQALGTVSPSVPATRPRRFAAHWPEVHLPERPEQVEIMQPAPTLPPVIPGRADHNQNDVGRCSPRERPLSKPKANIAATPASSPLLAPLRQQLKQLAELQQQFMQVQSTTQRQFLELRGQAQALLLRQAHSSTDQFVAPPLPTTPTGAPPAPQPPPPAPTTPDDAPVGPSFSRAQLLIHADGQISEIFGAAFAGQDQYLRQVRMPRPPLLLADRVLGIEGAPGSMGKGRIWTETEVGSQDWYLQHQRMPAGVLIEAGQADLLLISWLGVDALNRGERVYRLLGCELTYHGDLPRLGDRLRFDIRIDGHAAQGDLRLMFFHYECHNGDRPQLSVREGQAGFFTAAELAASAGCLWQAEQQQIVAHPQLDPPELRCTKNSFSREQLLAFAAGDASRCFGPGFELARTHSRSPSIHDGKMLLLDRVTDFQTEGGPWQRGWLRAELDISPEQWFFDGHFKNDPCMPGTLMFEACLQAMALYLAGCGFTLKRDGWRFQPVPELPYQLQCRGQVTPASKLLVTELFVEELSAGPIPTLVADLLCTVDGLKAFHARRVALQLVPDWPLDSPSPATALDERPVAIVDGFRFDQHTLLACAHGRPSLAFGPMYRRFDAAQRVARLPSPPYLFMSRIAEVQGPIGVLRSGARVVAEYDLSTSAWYLQHNGAAVMPYAVLLEAALQPCGWLSSYVGSALTVDSELGFRNLDGEGTVLAELRGDEGVLRTEVELTEVSASAGMIIESFLVSCRLAEREVFRLRTVFGFFPPAALAAQVGLPISADQRELFQRPANLALDLESESRLPAAMLRLIDRIEGYWPNAGAAGLGQLRAVKSIDSGQWFFKAHFFQDPVQPGSLGLEAMLQTLQWFLLQIERPGRAERFQSIVLDRPHRWKYRGQVLPHHRLVHTTLDITAVGEDASGLYAVANGSLWVDGQRIYEASDLSVRLVPCAPRDETRHLKPVGGA